MPPNYSKCIGSLYKSGPRCISSTVSANCLVLLSWQLLRSVWRIFFISAFSPYSNLIVQIMSVSVVQCHTIYINIFPAFIFSFVLAAKLPIYTMKIPKAVMMYLDSTFSSYSKTWRNCYQVPRLLLKFGDSTTYHSESMNLISLLITFQFWCLKSSF